MRPPKGFSSSFKSTGLIKGGRRFRPQPLGKPPNGLLHCGIFNPQSGQNPRRRQAQGNADQDRNAHRRSQKSEVGKILAELRKVYFEVEGCSRLENISNRTVGNRIWYDMQFWRGLAYFNPTKESTILKEEVPNQEVILEQ